jgi:hypothetical protein
MVTHVVVCPVVGCRWVTPMLDHDQFTDHIQTHTSEEQASVFEALTAQIQRGSGLAIGTAVMFKVGHAG